MLHVAKSYHGEVTWRDEHYVPTDVDEHLQISLQSIAAMQTVVLMFISLGDVATREAIEWAITYPKIVRGVTVLARIMNDITSHEVCIDDYSLFLSLSLSLHTHMLLNEIR